MESNYSVNTIELLSLKPVRDSREAKGKFNFDLEALRGVAALVVVVAHAVNPFNSLDPAYHPGGIWTYAAPAHLSVLLFFVLSGYVIGKAHAAPLQKGDILVYLKKRFVRIYPIYLVCLLFVLLVLVNSPGSPTTLSHLFLIQGLTSPVLHEIAPSWSLTYEILFYLLFIPLSYFRIHPIAVAGGTVLLGIGAAYFFPGFANGLVPTYAFGFTFWLCGLGMAKYSRPSARTPSYAAMAGILFLFLTLGVLDSPLALLHQAQMFLVRKDLTIIPSSQDAYIVFRDFAFLPYCGVMVALFAGIKLRFGKALVVGLTLLPAISLLHYVKSPDGQLPGVLFFTVLFYIASVLFFLFPSALENPARKLIKRLVPLGSISYGLYIVHFPLLSLILSYHSFSGSGFSFGVPLVFFLLLSFAGAYFLEKVYQPRVRKAIG